MKVKELTDWLGGNFPAAVAEDWDNVGLYIIEPISAALPSVAFIALLLACLIAGAKLFAMAWGAPRHHAPAGEEPSPNPPAD